MGLLPFLAEALHWFLARFLHLKDCGRRLSFEMAESYGEDKGSGAWSRVPTWDGPPLTWRAFRREMSWWIPSLDMESTKKYNLAARWLLRQGGIVRQRGEEFEPQDLKYKPAVYGRDPESGEEIELEPEDCLFGLNKLLIALEGINGQTVLDKRGELRTAFYLNLQRKAGERVSEFATRFRTLVADLKSEGVALPTSELGWFFKDKLGLDPLRRQLLETALQGREEYNLIEAETLRLFKDLHLADPLYRKFEQRPKLTIRKMFHAMPASPPSSASSAVSRAPSSVSSRSSFRGPSSSASSTTTRKVYLTEVPEDQGDEDGTALVAEPEADDAETGADAPALEEILQTEAEAFASELQEAEEQGVDPSSLEALENGFEQAAEALVTMKEARTKLQEIRKDRGYGKSSLKHGGKARASFLVLIATSPDTGLAIVNAACLELDLVEKVERSRKQSRFGSRKLSTQSTLHRLLLVPLVLPHLPVWMILQKFMK